MTDEACECGDDACGEQAVRVEALERAAEELREELMTATNRDIPLLKGTIRAAMGAEIEDIDELPAAGRAFNQRVEAASERLDAVEEKLAALEEIDSEHSTKTEKFAAVIAFARNKRNGSAKVAVSPHEIKGCTGVSRRYAYELMDAMAESIEGVRVREDEQVRTGSGTKRKGKALLVDCEVVHTADGTVKEVTTEGEVSGGD